MSAVTELKFPKNHTKHGDDDGEDTYVDNVNVKVVSNGYMITTEFSDGEILEEICHTLPEVLEIIQENIE